MHMAIAISVTSDAQVFDESKRDRCDELRLQFEVVTRLPEGDRQVIKALIKGIVVKHETKRLVGRISGSGKKTPPSDWLGIRVDRAERRIKMRHYSGRLVALLTRLTAFNYLRPLFAGDKVRPLPPCELAKQGPTTK